jgi:multisubunit Na+/H+ antiporter MnhC subunit
MTRVAAPTWDDRACGESITCFGTFQFANLVHKFCGVRVCESAVNVALLFFGKRGSHIFGILKHKT